MYQLQFVILDSVDNAISPTFPAGLAILDMARAPDGSMAVR